MLAGPRRLLTSSLVAAAASYEELLFPKTEPSSPGEELERGCQRPRPDRYVEKNGNIHREIDTDIDEDVWLD